MPLHVDHAARSNTTRPSMRPSCRRASTSLIFSSLSVATVAPTLPWATMSSDSCRSRRVPTIGVGRLEALVHGDAGAQHRCGFEEADVAWEVADVVGIRQRVLREAAVDRVAGVLLLLAQRLPAAEAVSDGIHSACADCPCASRPLTPSSLADTSSWPPRRIPPNDDDIFALLPVHWPQRSASLSSGKPR